MIAKICGKFWRSFLAKLANFRSRRLTGILNGLNSAADDETYADL